MEQMFWVSIASAGKKASLTQKNFSATENFGGGALLPVEGIHDAVELTIGVLSNDEKNGGRKWKGTMVS